MRHVLFTLLLAGWACFVLAQGTSAIKFPSPVHQEGYRYKNRGVGVAGHNNVCLTNR